METQNHLKKAVIGSYNLLPSKAKAAVNFGCTEGHFRNIARPDKNFPDYVYLKAIQAIEAASKESFIEAKKIHDQTLLLIEEYRHSIEVTDPKEVTAA